MSDVGKTKPRLRESDATFSIVASPWYCSSCPESAMAPEPSDYGLETSTVNVPWPETRCTFNVSARWPQIS